MKKQISEKQFAANRINAAKSTGPKTPGGKYNSSRNDTAHGFLATSILIPGESRERFLSLLASFINQFQPDDPHSLALVENMAVSRWRSRHENRYDRQHHPSADRLLRPKTKNADSKPLSEANKREIH
jgi:hypothetical protein